MGSGVTTLALTRHLDTPCTAVTRIGAAVVRTEAGGLVLDYSIIGRIDALRLPSQRISDRADNLWQHSCFEAFAGAVGQEGYLEINLSPSTLWAAYGFDSYRSGMCNATVTPPAISVASGSDHYAMRAIVALPVELMGERLRVGLSAVIEEADGTKSYWALAHPPGKPDFHHSDCFALELAAPGQT